jgi:hypothetical protein
MLVTSSNGKERFMLKRFLIAAAVWGLLLSGVAIPATAASPSSRTARVTLTNLTEHQIFSPPLIAVGSDPRIFSLGTRAGRGLRLIAEEGDSSVLAASLSSDPRVSQVVALTDPLMHGDSISVDVPVGDGERLSVATMLVDTNDGFTGTSGFPLDEIRDATLYLRTFDAGTEVNNEKAAFVPGPPFDGHRRQPEHGFIGYHKGIKGLGDLDPSVYGWTDPSASLTIHEM